MGGKTSTTTQSVAIPPEVLARYNAVNTRAEEAAKQPFQAYGGQFVAGLTPTQQEAISRTSQSANAAQPYYQMATGLSMAGAQDVGPLTSGQIGYYMNPYTQAVAAPTYEALRQQQGQELSQQQAQAIKSGAAFGERSGLERANLVRQQALGTAQAMAPIYSQAYQQAVQTAAGQQGVVGQDLARRLQAGQQIGALGSGAQAAALQGAQAQLAAGTAEQQTQQADLTARYQQFLQERGYPFQVAQFLANIAMGTGALSGSTTTTTQPAGFFSDERLKKDAVRIGATDEGVPIYSFRYKGEDGPKRIGLMAQDVEQVHPEAVGLAAAADGRYYKTVDYEKATERPHREYGGGLSGIDDNWMGGAVGDDSFGASYARGGYVAGGIVNPNDLQAILAAQKEAFGPFGQSGLYGGKGAGSPAPGLGGGIVPEAKLPVPKLVTASMPVPRQRSGFEEAASVGKNIADLYNTGKELRKGYNEVKESIYGKSHGGAAGYASGGEIDPYDLSDDPLSDVVKAGKAEIRELPKPGQPPGAPKSGFGELADLAKGATSLYSLGSTLAALLPFSDERVKKDVQPVGETYNGQTIYRYNLGDGVTQIGLMAQESRKDAVHKDGLGLLHLDYKKATEDSVPFASGGLVPRPAYEFGGDIENFSAESDPPAIGAQKVASEDDVARIANALRRIESSNRYDALGKVSPKTGDRAYGAYQVMGANIPSWSKEAIGRSVTPDEFLSSRELQDQIARHRIGKYLDQYGNATDVASSWFSGRPASKAMGLSDFTGTSVPTYLKRFAAAYEGDLPAERAQNVERLAPLGEAAGRKAGEYAGVPAGKASVGDVAREYLPKGIPTSEKFWVPALGFLGSMLASKSPTLGQAIGEGLVGGVSAYTGIEKGRADISRTEADTRAVEQRTDLELVDRLLKFNQVRLARGQTPIRSLEEFKKKLSDGSIVEQTGEVQGDRGAAAPGASAAAAPRQDAAAAPNATTQAAPQQPLPADATERAIASQPVQQSLSQIDWSRVADSHNIPKIQEELRRTASLANTATDPAEMQKYQERQAALRTEISKILESRQLVLKDGSVVVPPEWQRIANQIKAQEVTAGKDAERFAGIQDSMERMQEAAPEILQRFGKMGDILQRLQTDPAQNFKTYAAAIADAVGINISSEKIESRADLERFVKSARDQLFNRLQEVGGRILVSEIQRMQESLADPSLQPASNRSLIAQGKALTEYHQSFYDSFRDWKKDNPYATADDFARFRRDWQKQNSLKGFIDRAEAETPVRGDLPDPTKRKNGWLYIDDSPRARNLTLDGRKVTPNGFIGRWDKERNVFTDLRPL